MECAHSKSNYITGGRAMKKTYELSLAEMFSHFDVLNDSSNIKLKTYNTFRRTGVYKFIEDFRGKSFFNLLKSIKKDDCVMCAIMVIVAEHYGVHIEIPDLSQASSDSERRKIEKINFILAEYKKKIEFND